jgi:ABC-type multidrug transport system fused ATPase/permease subunit
VKQKKPVKQKRGVSRKLKNVIYLYQLAWQYDKKYLFYLFLQFLLSTIEPFVIIIFPKLILDRILGGGSFLRVILLVAAVTGTMLITRNGLTTAKLKGELEGEFLMIRLRLLCNKINMTTAYEDIENPAYLDMRDRACQIIWNSSYFNTFAFSFANLLSGLLQLAGILAVITMLDGRIIVLLFLLFVVNMVYQIKVQKRNHDIDKDTAQIRRKWDYLDRVATDFQYGKMIRLEALSGWFGDKSRQNREDFYKKQKSIINNNTKVTILGSVFSCLQELGIYIYLIYKVIYDNLTIGSFSMYLAAVNRFSASLSSILDNTIQINKYNLFMEDFRNFLSAHPVREPSQELKHGQNNELNQEISHGQNNELNHESSQIPSHKSGNEPSYEQNIISVTGEKPTIEFRHVSFRYPRTDKWILKDINLIIHPGEKISLVGDNGAGKTTLIKLMTGLYTPTEGNIILNGIDSREYDFGSYQKFFGAVFQDYKIFAFTIHENITLGEKTEEEKIEKVLLQSGLKEKVDRLSNRADTYMSKKFEEQGMELSGGEQQKLSLARALYQDAPVLILDEPTANLSPLAEHDIYKQYYQMTEEKTALFVSHRLSSSLFCDRVVLLEKGTITECGSHDSLMEQGGTYYEMFQLQAGYYND